MGLLQFLSYHNKDGNEFPLTCLLLLNKNSWNHGLTWVQLSQNIYSSGFCLDPVTFSCIQHVIYIPREKVAFPRDLFYPKRQALFFQALFMRMTSYPLSPAHDFPLASG